MTFKEIQCSAVLAACCLTSFSHAQDDKPRALPEAKQPPASRGANFARGKLVAWCIVPFDGKKRGPAERAEMLKRIGIKRVAYDWRQQHVATFEEEIRQYAKHGLEYFAFWGVHEKAFALFKKYNLRPQIWQIIPAPTGNTQEERVASAVKNILPLVRRTKELGFKLGLYNHGGWSGEPQNLVAVCDQLRKHHRAEHVGIVYNQHHAHGHIKDFSKVLKLMEPYLLCLNLNGMATRGDQIGMKILPLGEGEHDVALMKQVRDSGYKGPLGIIGHTQDDVEKRLLDNLDGLEWILPQLDGKPAKSKPRRRTWSPEKKKASRPSGVLLPGKAVFRKPPITVECRATLSDRSNYNILVASDSKRSRQHWEIFSMHSTGLLTAYLPGLTPDHVRSKAMICDGKPHVVAMTYEPTLVRLFVDGAEVAREKVRKTSSTSVPGDLGIGRLVEQNLRCSGTVHWVRISRGAINPSDTAEVQATKDTIAIWRAKSKANDSSMLNAPRKYSPQLVANWTKQAIEEGSAARGLATFTAAKSACMSCHRIGQHGGTVGPPLTTVGKDRKASEIVESVVWPNRHTKPEFTAFQLLTSDGRRRQGYVVRRDAKTVVIKDPTKPEQKAVTIAVADIEAERQVGSLMPDNLTATMNEEQRSDLFKFLFTLGRPEGVSAAELHSLLTHAMAHRNGPATFEYERKPLQPENWPSWKAFVNRDRIYDFYGKQAEHFRRQTHRPAVLADFPGLDGGELGHWGNQNEEVWKSDKWSKTQLSNVQCGIFRGAGVTVPRGVCIQLGENSELATCFNPDTLTYDAVWRKGFLGFSNIRHGFMNGVQLRGEAMAKPPGRKPQQAFQYRGYYRIGRRIVFAYRIGEKEYLDSPHVVDGKFQRLVAPAAKHPLRPTAVTFKTQWPQKLKTPIRHGTGAPYAVDTIELPHKNPWNSLLFCGGHAFAKDGSAYVCTMQGDVWHVSNIQYPSRQATWKRFAAGLHHCQGILVDDDGIFVLGRDQITRLVDLNSDNEADFYECFSNAFETSSAGHDFICGLERDANGNFYTASGNQGLVKISRDGRTATVVATGFRNPDGLGLTPDGVVTVPCSEGEWTPASMICAFRLNETSPPPFFGFRGPKNGKPPHLPLAYLPRGVDNSAGGQTVVNSKRWGPLNGQLLHFSLGTGSHFLILRDQVQGQMQGAVVPLPGEFRSGAHRGRFNPADGQLYVTGMQGWGCYTTDVGCFERVRYTNQPAQLPVGFHVHQNGVLVRFSEMLDRQLVEKTASHFAQCWNYRYSSAYGSPEFSTRHFGMRGHDVVAIRTCHVLPDGKSVFIELPDLQPVNQLHLRLQSKLDQFHDLFVTIHRMDKPFTQFSGYKRRNKSIRPHPILADLAYATKKIPNPFARKLKGGRKVVIETGTNLTFATRSFEVKSGEVVEFTLRNPDVVPHNWALLKPGTLSRVGHLANRLISDPEAALRQYVPQSTDVLAYTDIVLPKENMTIYFRAPKQPGRYPFLCTFPGHWLVMNGEMIVRE